MSNRTFVIGVGKTKFEKPGSEEGDYPDWAKEAGEKALADAGIAYDDIEQAYAGYCYGDSTYGQRALYGLGLTGIPVNVNSHCSTGSSALVMAPQAGVGGRRALQPDVCELHDCFSANELITYEALGFAAEGEGHKLVEAEATTFGGDVAVNRSGGLVSKGHPLGATGLAQCSELDWQLRGTADKRQVEGAKVALQHNIGLGGAAVVTVYKPASPGPPQREGDPRWRSSGVH